MGKFEWLKDYQRIEDEVLYLENNLERTKRELGRFTGGDLYGVKLEAESRGARLEDIIDAIEYELAHKMNDLFDINKLIEKFRGVEHRILFGKYVQGKTLEEVAVDLGYSSQYIYAKHAQIKRLITFLDSV